MKKRENRFRVFTIAPFVMLFSLLIGALAYILTLMWAEKSSSTIVTQVISILFLIVLPFLSFCLFAIIYWPVVEINEQGVKKTFFGKEIKQYRWSEIKDISIKTSSMDVAKWIYFSKSDLTYATFSKAQMKRDSIKLMLGNSRIIEVIKRYAPKELIENIR